MNAGTSRTDSSVTPKAADAPLIELALPREGLASRAKTYLRRRWRGITAVAAMGVGAFIFVGHVLGGVAGLWEVYRLVTGHGHAKPEAAAQRPFRSIVVLPFSSEPGAAHDPGGTMARELAHALRRAYPDMTVVSPSSAGASTSVARDVDTIGRQLNVRYVLDGKLRNGPAEPELWLEAVDSVDRSLVWSGRYPLPGSGQAESLNRARVDLRNAIVDSAAKDIQSLPANKRVAWESVLKAYAEGESIGGLQRIQGHFEAALRSDPEFPNALRGLSHALWQRMQDDPSLIPTLMPRMDEVSAKAVRLAPADPRVWTARSVALRLGGNLDAAFVASDEALRLDPYDPAVLSNRAGLLIYAARPREAFPVLARSRELHANDPNFMTNAAVWECLAHFQLADGEASSTCERAAGLWDRWLMFTFPASIHAEAGNRERAAFWLAKLLAANPNATLERVRDVGYLNSPAPAFRHATDRWVEGLRKAGLPER